MSIGTIICMVIYESFLLLAAALEILIFAAETLLQAINLFFEALVTMITNTIDVVMSGYVTLLEKAITTIADLILSKFPNKMFCTNLFKCIFFLQQLMDSASTVHGTLKKWGVLSDDSKFGFSDSTNEKLSFLYSLVTDFQTFQETVCEFGLTFAISLDSLKAIMATIQAKVNAFIKFLTKKKDAIMKLCQRYIDELKNSGILDFLKKLTQFFKCVVDMFSDTCTSLETAHSFYKDCLEKLNIEESGDGFRFNQETTDTYTSFIDGRLKSIKNVSKKAQDVFDQIDEGLGLKGASNGFNLASLLGSADITDLKNTWRKTSIGSYFIAKSREFKRIFYGTTEAGDDSSTYDYVLNNMSINEASGEITIIKDDQKIIINEQNCAQYGFSMEAVPDDEQIEPIDDNYDLNSWFIDPDTDMLMSARRAGHKAHKDPDGTIAKHCLSVHDKMYSGIPEYELATAWSK